MNKKTPEIQNRSETALKILDSLLNEPGRKKINESQIIVILDALASAEDAEVVARFPAVLAICARRGLVLNSQALFARYWETSPKRQNLEKLLLVSAAIFKAKGLTPPGNLNQIAASLKHKYGDLLPTGEIQMSSGMHVSVPTLHWIVTWPVRDPTLPGGNQRDTGSRDRSTLCWIDYSHRNKRSWY